MKALDYLDKPVDLEEIKEGIRRAVNVCMDEKKHKKAEQKLLGENELHHQEQQALFWLTSHREDANKAGGDSASFPQGASFVTAIIKFHHVRDNDNQSILLGKHELLGKIGCRFSAFDLDTLRGFKDSQHLIIHAYSKNLAAPEQLLNPLALARSDLQELMGSPLQTFIGVGHLVHRPEGLLESYHSAAVAVQRQFFIGYNQIVVFQESFLSSAGYHPDWELLTQQFEDHLEEEQTDKAVALLERFSILLKETEDTLINDAKNVFFGLLLAIFKAADRKKLSLSQSSGDREYLWNVVFRFNTLQEMAQYTKEKLDQFFEHLQGRVTGGSIAFAIMRYIQVNYKNPNLSIKSIADHIFLTPNYLSLQFKKETGQTINEYIIEFRISKAKELLSDRQHKLYEVAAQVGIMDANYFAKTFKKVTGMTPSEFKEKHL
ncbi:AraC family transcriptional regulator [Gorillibacterium massiliense]|uniref:AraC family transcriptional regulator n=1 Tax=Gorillibacterium massiliense TaxID=1280390 RepID=UPI001EE1C2B4|nr:AraC family transcriptional regulator [Gorillibacterium massiliense]